MDQFRDDFEAPGNEIRICQFFSQSQEVMSFVKSEFYYIKIGLFKGKEKPVEFLQS